MLNYSLVAILIFLANSLFAVELRVGIAKKVITPDGPAYLSGYSNRNEPSTGAIHDIWAKALAFEDEKQGRVIIVTTDVLGLSHEISEDVARQVLEKYGISRSQFMLNSSHTHSGPMIWPSLSMIADYTAKEQQVVSGYSHKLTADLVEVIGMAIADLKPMQVFSGHGSVDFAMNRRIPLANGKVKKGENPDGPVDHDVPVLKIASPGGDLKAVLFGYACHNTTIFRDNYLINGDYAGYAQIELEKAYPGVTAMFMMGCGGDQNPSPRGTIKLAEVNGKALAAEVIKVLQGRLKPVKGPVRTDFEVVSLDFQPFDLETYQKDIVGDNVFLQRRARLMLEAYNKSWDVSQYPFPVQAIRFGKDLSILALGGETVVEYSLKAKEEFAGENLFVAGYSNEVMCYIPTRKMLPEGGYEPEESMIYYGMPGPFAANVEEKIFGAIRKVMRNVGAKSSGKSAR